MKRAPGHCAKWLCDCSPTTDSAPPGPGAYTSHQAGRVCSLSAVAHLFFPNHWPEALLQVQGRDTLYSVLAHWILLDVPLCVYKITASFALGLLLTCQFSFYTGGDPLSWNAFKEVFIGEKGIRCLPTLCSLFIPLAFTGRLMWQVLSPAFHNFKTCFH